MNRIKFGFLSWANRPQVKRLSRGLVLVTTVVSTIMAVYMGTEMLRGAGSTRLDDWLLGTSVMLAALGLASFGRKLCLRIFHGTLSLGLRLLAFPVFYVRDQALWIYFAITGGGTVVGFYKLASAAIVSDIYLYLALGCLAAFVAGLLYHLVRHRLAEVLAVVAVLPLLAGGIWLLVAPTAKEDSYNLVMELKQTEEGKKDLATQQKLLDVCLNKCAQDYDHSRLHQLVWGEPSVDLAARAYFHKAVSLVQMPNKGKEAFDECTKSLGLNPGNMYSGLSLDEVALWKNDSDQARRLLEKLIRSGQDGGKGRPNQPGNPGEQGQPQPDRRDPSRQPQPGSGRQPNKIL